MEKRYNKPIMSVSCTRLRTTLLAGSLRPDGTERPKDTAGIPQGSPTDEYDTRKRVKLFEF